jgi:hypothetical protein
MLVSAVVTAEELLQHVSISDIYCMPNSSVTSRSCNGMRYSRLSIIRAWFNRFAAQPRQCIFKEKILFSVSITFV